MLSSDGLLRLWTEIYEMTDTTTPLPTDCGKLCDSMCCRDWAPGVGVYLYPGEQLLIGDEPWLSRTWHDSRRYVFPPSWKEGGWFVTCEATCRRSLRPFGCRTFPLAPHLDTHSRLTMVLDENGGAICPLVQAGETALLTARFRATMRRAWMKLLCLKPIRDDVLQASSARDYRSNR